MTPLARAFKIERELLKAKAIKTSLGDSALMAMATAIGGALDSTKDQVAEVVNQIQLAAATTLEPCQVLKVEDLVLETGDARYCGWAVQAGVEYQLVDPYNQPQGFLVSASGDAVVPNADGQMLFHAAVSGSINILDQNTLTARASYDTVLCDTSSLQASYSLLRVQPLEQPATTTQTAALHLSLVVGRIDMGLRASLAKAANVTSWTLDVSVSASIDFDF